jgi:8-oxo-dGTP diphosphatase
MIAAAGALPWRRRQGRLEVLVVHRPSYDDWAWSKGKLDPGEEWPVAAVREVEEETGLVVRLGRPLPGAAYRLVDKRSGELATKEVRYWAAEVVGGDGDLLNEIDEVAWLEVAEASDRLHYARDRDQLRALVRAAEGCTLQTWPLAIVRHAKALGRSTWAQPDPLRPLDAWGRQRAGDLVPLLGAYGITRLVSSPSLRCADTLRPYAKDRGLDLRLRPGLSEEGYALDPAKALNHLTRSLSRGEPAVICSHGPVMPDLLDQLAARVDEGEDDSQAVALTLAEAADLGMAKGEVLVAHVAGTGDQARVVDVERHHP